MTQKRALITGITGQDGSYLAEFLLQKGYEVHGLVRRSSSPNTARIDHLFADSPPLYLHQGDLTDSAALRRVLDATAPDEIYNLGAQSHVGLSFEIPEFTADVDALGTLRLFEAARQHEQAGNRKVRIYQAGTSEMFGAMPPPQSEATPFHPRSPYGVSKVAAHWYGVNYRESYGMFICNGQLFNHESPRRGENFVTRKITRAVGRIKHGMQDKLYLGNLDARRDWGYAGDFVEAMWLMLQQDTPDDFVIATGYSNTVREFLDEAFGLVDLDWQDFVEVDPRFFRPAEVEALHGDATKARDKLGWQPKVGFAELVKMMVEHDLKLAEQEKLLRDAGHTVAATGAGCGVDLRGMVAPQQASQAASSQG